MGFWVDTFDTGVMPDEQLAALCQKVFDLKPRAIIEKLQLRRPQFKPTASYGHFGRTDLPVLWEVADMVETLKVAAQRACV